MESTTAVEVVVVADVGVKSYDTVHVAAKREFAGNWEYLLDNAIFTTPPHPAWSGSALINRDGKLVGIGSLIVGDATGKDGTPGNMFVPIDALFPKWEFTNRRRVKPEVAAHSAYWRITAANSSGDSDNVPGRRVPCP